MVRDREDKIEKGESLPPIKSSKKKSYIFFDIVENASVAEQNSEFNGFEREIDKFITQLKNNIEKINNALSDEKQKGKIAGIEKAMSGIKEKIEIQKNKV